MALKELGLFITRGLLPVDNETRIGQIEWRNHTLADGGHLLVFSNNSTSLSWLRLKPGEAMASVKLNGSLANSTWVKKRIGEIPPARGPITMIVGASKDDVNIVDINVNSLDPTSKKYQLTSVETTDLDLQAGELTTVTAQKAQAKDKLNVVVEAQLNGEGQGIHIYTTPQGEKVYHILVDEKTEQASLIAGDTNSKDSRYNPSHSKTKKSLTSDGMIPLYRKGDDLIVRVNLDGSYSYVSPNFGKTKTVASSIVELTVGENGEKIGQLMDRQLGKVINLTKQNVKRYFVEKILRHATSVLNPEESLVKNPDTITTALRDATKKLMVDKESNPVVDSLIELYDGEARYLLENVYPKDLSSDELNQWIFKQLNEHVPEWWYDKFLSRFTNEIGQTDMLQMIAQWEAVGVIKKKADRVARALGLWYFASQTTTDPTPYREEVQQALGGKLPDMGTLKELASAMKLSLGEAARMLREITPTSSEVESHSLGTMVTRTDIPSSIERFHHYPDYVVRLPENVLRVMGEILVEYNSAFTPLVLTNQEWDTDYRFCKNGSEYMNHLVQVDVAGLPQSFFEQAVTLPDAELKKILKGRIFEIENSLAMYNFMRGIFAKNGNPSYFQCNFDAALEELRKKHGDMKIALLAVTDQKFMAMLSTEFGIKDPTPETRIEDERVKQLSGFDKFISPAELEELIKSGEIERYLIYARTSLPVAVLKDPKRRNEVRAPLLENPETRRVIKERALTFNIDHPEGEWNRSINDTKAYMRTMNLANPVTSLDDLTSDDLVEYLISLGVRPEEVDEISLRAKPMHQSYGAYGHIRGHLNKQFRAELERGFRERGPYVIQREIPPTRLKNADDGREFGFIDRIFFYISSSDASEVRFMGGFRDMMPIDSQEFESHRIHGATEAVWAEIKPENA